MVGDSGQEVGEAGWICPDCGNESVNHASLLRHRVKYCEETNSTQKARLRYFFEATQCDLKKISFKEIMKDPLPQKKLGRPRTRQPEKVYIPTLLARRIDKKNLGYFELLKINVLEFFYKKYPKKVSIKFTNIRKDLGYEGHERSKVAFLKKALNELVEEKLILYLPRNDKYMRV